MNRFRRWLCKFGWHKWPGWSVDSDGHYVVRARRCSRCFLADYEEGYIANTEPKPQKKTRERSK